MVGEPEIGPPEIAPGILSRTARLPSWSWGEASGPGAMVSAQMLLSPPVRTPVIRTPVEVRWPVIGPTVVDRPPVGPAIIDRSVVRTAVVDGPVVCGSVVHAPVGRVAIAVVGGAGRCREPQDASGNRAGRDGATVIRSPPAPTITTVTPAVPPPVNILG